VLVPIFQVDAPRDVQILLEQLHEDLPLIEIWLNFSEFCVITKEFWFDEVRKRNSKGKESKKE
jgi:hypothetical protein